MTVAIGFDFDHTLGIDRKLERTAMMRLAGELGVEIGEGDVARLAQIDTLLAEMREDKIDVDQMIGHFLVSIDREPDPSLAQRFRDIAYALVPYHVRPLASVPETLAELQRRGVPIAILTNGWSPLQEKKVAQIGYTGTVFCSGALGVAKPDERAFAVLREHFGAEPRIWYVGDNPVVDVRGALGAGLEAIWFQEHPGAAYPGEIPAPSATITALRDLLDLLDSADGEGRPGRLRATTN